MTLTQLRYIIAIADTGSMNEAAKSLFISQPSLSLAVKELEKEIGTELFKRSNRGVSVTQEGMEFTKAINGEIKEIRIAPTAAAIMVATEAFLVMATQATDSP